MDLETLEKENESYHKQDAVKLKLLINLIKAYVKSDPAKSIQAGDQAVALAEMLNDNDLLAGTYNSLAASHKNTGNFDEAVRLLEKALSINRASGNDNGTATDLLELGDVGVHDPELRLSDCAVLLYGRASHHSLGSLIDE